MGKVTRVGTVALAVLGALYAVAKVAGSGQSNDSGALVSGRERRARTRRPRHG